MIEAIEDRRAILGRELRVRRRAIQDEVVKRVMLEPVEVMGYNSKVLAKYQQGVVEAEDEIEGAVKDKVEHEWE